MYVKIDLFSYKTKRQISDLNRRILNLTGFTAVRIPMYPAKFTDLKTVFPPFWKSKLTTVGRRASVISHVLVLTSHLERKFNVWRSKSFFPFVGFQSRWYIIFLCNNKSCSSSIFFLGGRGLVLKFVSTCIIRCTCTYPKNRPKSRFRTWKSFPVKVIKKIIKLKALKIFAKVFLKQYELWFSCWFFFYKNVTGIFY